MAFDKFLIGPLNVGLQTDLKPFMVPDEAFVQLENAYVFRGRVRKRFGSRLLGVDQTVSRLRINVGTTDIGGDITDTVPGDIFKVGQMFSVGPDLFTVVSLGTPAAMLATSITTAGTYNTNNGDFTINSSIPLTPVYFYPAEPVMGLTQYERGAVNNFPAYAFDTQFAYAYGGAGWARSNTGADPVWHGNDSNFFWVANWQGLVDSDITMFVTNFQVTNYTGPVAGTDDPLWAFDSINGWRIFTPQFLTAGNKVKTARIIVAFKNRLVLLNTVELNTAGNTNTNYVNRCRFSQNGSPFEGGLPNCATAWLEQRQAGSHQAGFIDATTEEAIISAEFIKDRLIVYFERSTWELAYTGNEIQPFIWQKLNTELGSESTFSTVPFDREILTVGTVGVHSCNGSNVSRVDQLIPDQIFEIRNINSGPARVAGIRDYFTEMVYWSYPNSAQAGIQTFPNKVLVYNYKNGAWAINDDCITAFGYFEQQTGLIWANMNFTWASWNTTWASGTVQAQFRQVLAGNQEGFTFIIDPESGSNAAVLQITNMTYDASTTEIELTIINHTLTASDPTDFDYIKIVGAQGVTYTGLGIYKVTRRIDANTIRVFLTFVFPEMEASFTGVYTGGGTAARVSQIDILTKQWNFYQNVGKNVYIQKIDFNVTKTTKGQITVDYYPSSTSMSMIEQAKLTGAAMGTSILETSPYVLQPLEEQQNQLWHPVFFQTDGETVQLRIYFNDAQLQDPTIAESAFELNAMLLYAQQISRLQ